MRCGYGFKVSNMKSIIIIGILIRHTIPMKIVLCNHTKSNKSNKYNGIIMTLCIIIILLPVLLLL